MNKVGLGNLMGLKFGLELQLGHELVKAVTNRYDL